MNQRTNSKLDWLETSPVARRVLRWLANDDHRYAVTSTIPLLFAFLIFLIVQVPEGQLSRVILYLTAYGILWSASQVGVTWLVFARLPADEFSELINATQRERGTTIRPLAGLDEGPATLGSQVSLLMVGLTLFVFVNPTLRDDRTIVVMAAVMVIGAWLLTAFSYAVEYARTDLRERGLDFPGSDPVSFTDYVYHAICVNATFAASDVTVISNRMRRLTTTQTLLAFFFNTVNFALLTTLLTSTLA